MKYIQAPQSYELNPNEKTLFLAGGITGCRDWQSELIELLKNENIILLNPRRECWDSLDPNAEFEQIKWEHNALNKADSICFWFSKETLCPITLYELGKMSAGDKKLFIGIEPQYKRKSDVEIQTSFIRPDVRIVYSINELAQQIKQHHDSK